jgi:cyclophilin family peptidyl-prolyl cis-trans isomerase
LRHAQRPATATAPPRLLGSSPLPRALLLLLQFGEVTKGLDIVKKIETYGSSSGKTKASVVITESGQLA